MANILIFSANYLPNVGGIERFTYYNARYLLQEGHQVTIVTNNLFDLPDHEINEGIEIYRFPCYPLLNGRYPIKKPGKRTRAIQKDLNARHFDFVMINARFYLHSIYGAKFAAKRHIPVITVEHGSSHMSVNNRLLDTLGGWFEHWQTAILKRYCKDYYGVSQECCRWSGHFGIVSKGVIYNAVELPEIQRLAEHPCVSFREKLGMEPDAPVILFAGRLIREKGIYELIQAVRELDFPKLTLWIAGDGPEKESIAAQTDQQVRYLGKLCFEEVIAALKETDIYCLPSQFPEGLPTGVLEAAAMGVYVITTQAGGAKELITGREYGCILKDRSVGPLKDAILWALENPQERTAAAQACRERLKESFTFDKTAQRILQIMRDMQQ